MAEKSTFIKIDRNILDWRWYKNINTFKVFIHLLLTANIKPVEWEKITINRGQTVTSLATLRDACGLSVQSVRTALERLKSTGSITVEPTSKYSIITINNFDKYQTVTRSKTNRQQAVNKQSTVEQQQSKNILSNDNIKNERNKEERCAPPEFSEVKAYIDQNYLNVNPSEFFEFYEKNGWTNAHGKSCVSNWQQVAVNWSKNEKATYANGYHGVKNRFTYKDYLEMVQQQKSEQERLKNENGNGG